MANRSHSSNARLRVTQPGETPRGRILEAALRLLADLGYDGMSLQMVANEVGLHKSSLFHHFRGKDELVQEVCRDIADKLLAEVAPLIDERPPTLEQILLVTDAMVDHFARERASARLLMRLLVANADFSLGPDGAEDPIKELLTGIGTWLERARRAGVIRPVRVRHALLNVMGVALFYPATAHAIGNEILEADPWSAEALGARKKELRRFLAGALSKETTLDRKA